MLPGPTPVRLYMALDQCLRMYRSISQRNICHRTDCLARKTFFASMSEAKPEAKAGDKTSLNTCYDALQSKVDQALLQLSGLEQTLKIGTPAPHKLKTYEALRDVLDSMKAVDESTMLLDNLPEKERPQIPSKLLEWLDEGKDPDAFYKHLIDDTIWGSQVMQGKMSAMSHGRTKLREELNQTPGEG